MKSIILRKGEKFYRLHRGKMSNKTFETLIHNANEFGYTGWYRDEANSFIKMNGNDAWYLIEDLNEQ